jgi:hypothetical protein
MEPRQPGFQTANDLQEEPVTLRRRFVLAFILCAAWVSAEAATPSDHPGFSFFGELGAGYVNDASSGRLGAWGGAYDLVAVGLSYSSDYIDFGAAFHVTNDGKYTPTEPWMQRVGNQYFMLDNGYTRLHAAGLAFEAGYLNALSTIETPYEVFLNPAGHSALGMVISYEGRFLQYESRWIGVNVRSSNTYGYDPSPTALWQDKGVNYRLIAAKFSDFRVGYEESSVYLRAFDPNYFFSPLPSILTNTILTQGGNPWAQGDGQNDNSLMGLFSDYKSGPLYAEAQLLVDDINLNFLFPSNSSLVSPNLDKLAWSVGGRYTFPFGTLGFWHGGATAHTYAASYSSATNPNTIPYEYVYYPTVEFPVGSSIPMDPRDSSIGFPWGENALAFKITFDTDLLSGSPWAFGLSTSIEYVINGSKSPDNPWHQYGNPGEIPQRIQLFDVGGPEVLNHLLIIHAGVTKKLGDLEARLGVDLGGDFNALGVTAVGDNEPAMLTATSSLDYFILDLFLAVRYTFAASAQ